MSKRFQFFKGREGLKEILQLEDYKPMKEEISSKLKEVKPKKQG